MKIQTRLTLSFVLFSLAVLASVGALVRVAAREALADQARSRLFSVASLEKIRLDAVFNEACGRAEAAAARPRVLSACDTFLRERGDVSAARERVVRALEDAARASGFRALTVLGPDGRAIAATAAADAGFASRPDSFFREDKGDLVAALRVPVRLDGRTAATLVAEADMEALLDSRPSRGPIETRLVLPETGGGALVYAARSGGLSRGARDAKALAEVSASGRASGAAKDGSPWAAEYWERAHGAIVARESASASFAPLRRLAAAFAWGAAAWLLAIVVFSSLLARSVAAPLGELTRAALAIASGRPARRPESFGDLEISALARAFDDMGTRLLEANELLERKVDERTSELRRSKDTLDKIINSVADPIFVKDRRHRFVLLNDACCQLVGRRRDEMIGMSDYDLFPKDQADVFWEKDELVFRSGHENVNAEEITDAAGRYHALVTKKTRYVDADGRQFIVGVIRDVTGRRPGSSSPVSRRRFSDLAKLAGELDREIRKGLRSQDAPPKGDFR